MSRTSTTSSSRRKATASDPYPVPERPEEIRRTLDALGVRPSRAWGQSFLTDPFVADAEAALVEVPPGRPVVEVGGGLGILTAALVRRGIEPLTVIERDPRLAGFLRSTFGRRVRVVVGDALEVDLPLADGVVGNLPYSVATPILVRLLERRTPRVVFLVQREVAERLAAGPGSKQYGRLSLLAALYGTVELFRPVSAAAFSPVPEVESRIGVHTARPGALPVSSVPRFEEVVRVLFSSRRKQLGNLLPRLTGGLRDPAELARAAGWPTDWSTRRPEQLPPEAFFALANALDAGP
ncbi:MAG TPA: 16S rRNA (adenine(1518)-N(6)/adenine(1519)-N(6))-dimethyltransferase RsmA [Thermoplasmata archaeon]|nr:16S rRNA (adenine(1518)-N(6)/adenine(1519)-N(6))-dimethyltransferase RsmA [Thermoplasmata archaeon]